MTQTENSAVRGREAFSGYLFHNPDTGTEWNISHPIESGECGDATDIQHATFPLLISHLQDAWQALAESEAEKLRNILEAETRGAEKQRRKDAEGQEPAFWEAFEGGDWVRTANHIVHQAKGRKVRPLYTRPANVASLEARVQPLEAENEKFRNALSAIAKHVGGFASPNCSVDFMTRDIPEEVRLSFAALTHEGGE